jgi:hypothetical protein
MTIADANKQRMRLGQLKQAQPKGATDSADLDRYVVKIRENETRVNKSKLAFRYGFD